MNLLAAAALVLLAAAQDPRAFRMPAKKKPTVKPPAVTAPVPVVPAEEPKAPELPAEAGEAMKPAPPAFRLPNAAPAPAAEPDAVARPQQESAGPTEVKKSRRNAPAPPFALPGQDVRPKKAPKPVTFRLPQKKQ